MRIGVVAVQGAFAEHIAVLERMGISAFEIRQEKDLSGSIDGLILPGGAQDRRNLPKTQKTDGCICFYKKSRFNAPALRHAPSSKISSFMQPLYTRKPFPKGQRKTKIQHLQLLLLFPIAFTFTKLHLLFHSTTFALPDISFMAKCLYQRHPPVKQKKNHKADAPFDRYPY